MRVKHLIRWLTRRSTIVVATLLIAIGVLLAWFIVTGFSQTDARIFIGIATISAFLAAVSAIANLMSATEIQRQRESQERPYVVVHLDGASNGLICVFVENFGNSPAENVVIKFDPVPVDFQGRPLSEVSLFKNPISFMPPGKTFRQAVDVGYRFLAEGKPTNFSISTSYSSIHGERYGETVTTDLAYLKQATRPGKSVEEEIEAVTQELHKLVSVVESARGMNSLLVESPEQYYSRLQQDLSERDNAPKWKIKLRSLLQWALSKLG